MSNLLTKLRTQLPVIQAGMAGGITTPELVAAVADAGALGTIGAGYMDPEALKDSTRQVRKLTDKPFAVNVFAEDLSVNSSDVEEMQSLLDEYRDELELDHGSNEIKNVDNLQEKMDIILQEEIPIVSTAFGVLASQEITRLKNRGVTLIGMATQLVEAKQLEKAGYDVVVAQGSEAGGHRGTFDVRKFPDGCNMGLHVLIQQLKEQISLPIVAAGGIHTKKQVEALISMGASGVQLGTAFLTAKEAGTNDAYKQAVLEADGSETVITNVFSGRPARAIRNRFITEVETSEIPPLPFPVQNALTKDIRANGESELKSLWAGQGVGFVREAKTAKEIINGLGFEIQNTKKQ